MLDHEAIPGFMDAMTMPYKLKDASILSELHPGDVITADVLVSKSAEQTCCWIISWWWRRASRTTSLAVIYHVPAPGDAVPDFALRNQDGRTIHLRQFRGKELLITFIYTRCPLPNFCPLVTHNFAVIEKQLAADPALYKQDASALRELRPGARHAGDACAPTAQSTSAAMRRMRLPIGILRCRRRRCWRRWRSISMWGSTPGPDETITHTLSTTLIGPDGKVVQFYPGNEWTPDQVMADVKQAARGSLIGDRTL